MAQNEPNRRKRNPNFMSKAPRLAAVLAISMLSSAAFAASNVAANLESQGLLLTLAGIFFGGMLVSLTPCVYPMIPITLSIIGARSATSGPLAGFLRSLVFVLGIASIYTVMGLIVALSGGTFGALFQKKEFLVGMSLLFIAMGLSMLGLFNLQLPPAIAAKMQSSGNRGGFIGAFLLGITTGVVASPCGSPVLVSILLLAGKGGQPALGGIMLFTYALGIGMLFLVLGAFPAFLSKVPRSGVWMEDIKKFLGLVLILAAFYYLRLALPPLLVMGMLIATCLIFAAFIGIKSKERRQWPRLLWSWRAAALALVVVAFYVGVEIVPAMARAEQASVERKIAAAEKRGQTGSAGAAAGQTSGASEQPAVAPTAPPKEWLTDEAAAVAMGKANNWPVIIDFGAEWCAACKELEHKTFSDPAVEKELAGFVKVRIDCTEETPENVALQKKYNSISLPTIVFINAAGEVLPDLTLLEFEAPVGFLQRLAKVTGK
jgi:thiol:disulfide interchange protein DsbD